MAVLISLKVDLAQPSVRSLEITEPILPQEGFVQWQFIGLPNNYQPRIEFEVSEDGESPRGPFAHLRQTGNQVLGLGRSGTTQSTYTASIVPSDSAGAELGASSPVASEPLELVVGEQRAHPAPVVTVKPDPDDEKGLLVAPALIDICADDPVIWRFEEFESAGYAWHPVVRFTSGPTGSASYSQGPFTSITSGADIVVGTGNTHVTGEYSYNVAIVENGTNRVQRDADPLVGNNGDPPGGGG